MEVNECCTGSYRKCSSMVRCVALCNATSAVLLSAVKGRSKRPLGGARPSSDLVEEQVVLAEVTVDETAALVHEPHGTDHLKREGEGHTHAQGTEASTVHY